MIRFGRVAGAVVVALALVGTPGCGGSDHSSPTDPAATTSAGGLRTAVLTGDGPARYRVSLRAGTLRMAATGGEPAGNNLRELLWLSGAPTSADQSVCATWRRLDDPDGQQGVALRIEDRPGGDLRAITVTKNTFLRANWAFNVHVWDTARQPVLEQVGRIELEAAFRREGLTTAPLPWRMCARVRGRTVEVKVWPLAHAEPDWGDPMFTGTVDLPPGWGDAGHPGWYIGHLPAGAVAVYDHLVTSAGAPDETPQSGGGGGGG